jgi:hypothetical protein
MAFRSSAVRLVNRVDINPGLSKVRSCLDVSVGVIVCICGGFGMLCDMPFSGACGVDVPPS